MSWLRLSDSWDSDPAVLNMCRTHGDKARLLGWLVQLNLYCARHHTDGWLPAIEYRDVVRSTRWRDQLVAGRLIHQRGDDCPCLPGTWDSVGAAFYVHGYLESNPSKDEYDVQRAKAAELRDRELQARVRARDRGRCRYCGAKVVWADRRSSLGGVFDHVDPTIAAGDANLVVCCRGCNSRKGARTPSAAGMTLLPAPDQTHDHGGDQTADQLVGARSDHSRARTGRDGTGTQPPPPGYQLATGAPIGAGRATGGTHRTSIHPNPYLRTAITGADPLDHAGLPSPDDVTNALDHHDAFMPEGGP